MANNDRLANIADLLAMRRQSVPQQPQPRADQFGSEAAVEVLQSPDLEDLKYVSKQGWVTVVTRGGLVSFAEEHAAAEFKRLAEKIDGR